MDKEDINMSFYENKIKEDDIEKQYEIIELGKKKKWNKDSTFDC